MTKIGVISDTHGRLDAAIPPLFRGVDLIIHAGDIGKLDIIDQLSDIAPVFAVEGNNDSFGTYPTQRLEVFDGRRILILHIFGELHQIGPAQALQVNETNPDVVIFGHSHRPYEGKLDRVLLFNPGSAGPKRFSLPRTVGLLTFADNRILTKIISLDAPLKTAAPGTKRAAG